RRIRLSGAGDRAGGRTAEADGGADRAGAAFRAGENLAFRGTAETLTFGLETGERTMAITGITISRREAFADGAPFGAAGAYEKIIGTARGALDPANPANAAIAGLDRAARDVAGMVIYETDFYLLRPAHGSFKLLF